MNPPAIVGGKTDINPGGYVVLDFDDGDYYNNDTTHIVGGFGYGLWKLELAMSNNGQIVEYCSIDYRDANYTYGGGFTNDLMFILSELGGVYELEFQFKDGGLPLSIYDARIQSKTIKFGTKSASIFRDLDMIQSILGVLAEVSSELTLTVLIQCLFR